ncbi:hypothetical protein F5J12DRAFT_780595 [Pisolithus orientalis]|uniref:uncharacterized protein n=1 Tax=Pisolithus orientalis TaxID=936130 RepID=UPI0022253245|nr:uncharacterized protein F5J12DRAFT_780595 [Pisolithus orientalis]KAI6025796.1 hypothetical protein F5J12DRAFT_780595 [Pisolithus orientalis]
MFQATHPLSSGLIQRGVLFYPPYHIFQIPPPPSSTSAVEQETLDHSMLTQEDIDIQVYGSELPNLGPNFHSPQSLLAAADYYEAYNGVMVAGAQPLTAYHAHHLLPDPEGCALKHVMDNAFAEIQQQVPSEDPPSQGQLAELDDEILDIKFKLDDNADFELHILHDLLANFEIPSSCGKLPVDIGAPAGGSLTADQWLLLATVYGPIALWTIGLANAQQDGSLADCVALIAKQESKKKSKEVKKQSDAQALKDMCSQGREAVAAEKACITTEKATANEAKKMEKVRLTAEKNAKKAQDAELRQLAKLKANTSHIPGECIMDTTMADVPDENQQDDIDSKCILHPDDPPNFLKLCAAICLLIGNLISDQEISATDAHLQEYCMELIQMFTADI